MAGTLTGYMEQEDINITEQAVRYISRAADGSMRDALSILEQCAAMYHGEEITLEKVLEVCGAVDGSAFFKFADALSSKNAAACLSLIDEISQNGRDMNQFVLEFVSHLRDLLVASTAPNSQAADRSAENRQTLAAQAKKIGGGFIIDLIYEFSELTSRMKYSADPRVLLEVGCIKLCVPQSEKQETRGNQELKNNQEARSKKQEARNEKQEIKTEAKPKIQKAVPDEIRKAAANWNEFAASFPEPEASMLNTAKAGYLNDSRLSIICANIGYVSMLKRKDAMIKEKLKEAFGAEFDVNIIDNALYTQNHKTAYGAEDDFDYSDFDAGLDYIKQTINFDIEVK
jgi:DNA polymerase-3 subunit gamma/tau